MTPAPPPLLLHCLPTSERGLGGRSRRRAQARTRGEWQVERLDGEHPSGPRERHGQNANKAKFPGLWGLVWAVVDRKGRVRPVGVE